MRKTVLLYAAMVMSIGVEPRVFAAGRTYLFQDANAKGQVTFFSEAPVENIEGEAGGLSGSVYFDPGSPTTALQGTVNVAVDRMQTGLSMRDEHMRSSDWLDATRYPIVSFKLLPVEKKALTQKKPDIWMVNTKGLFSLKGAQKEIDVPVVLSLVKEKLTVTGEFFVSLKDFGIEGPAAMKVIGVRVGEKVRVRLKLVGQASNETPWPKANRSRQN